VSSSPPSARWHKRDDTSSSSASSRYLTKSIRHHLLLRKGLPVSYLCAHRETREQVPLKPLPSAIPARGVRQLGFWGATTRLLVPEVASSVSERGRELHYVHLPASTAVHDFEQRTITTSTNGASDALVMGPSAGYILFLSLCQFMVFMCYVASVIFYMSWMFVLYDTHACWYV
jgi:hypothetical protein